MISPCCLFIFFSLIFSFHVRSVPYQRKVGVEFFPEHLFFITKLMKEHQIIILTLDSIKNKKVN
jgi:hypothetical protein